MGENFFDWYHIMYIFPGLYVKLQNILFWDHDSFVNCSTCVSFLMVWIWSGLSVRNSLLDNIGHDIQSARIFVEPAIQFEFREFLT